MWTFIYRVLYPPGFRGGGACDAPVQLWAYDRVLVRVVIRVEDAPIATLLCRFVNFLAFYDCFPVHN
jgi:hypothetical protein